MDYYNSFMRNAYPYGASMGQPFQNYNFNNQTIDLNKLKQALPQLNDDKLQQLIAQARFQGMSDRDIESGLQFLQQLKNSSN